MSDHVWEDEDGVSCISCQYEARSSRGGSGPFDLLTKANEVVIDRHFGCDLGCSMVLDECQVS